MIIDPHWGMKKLKGNWYYSKTHGILHASKNHISDMTSTGVCKYCRAKAHPSIRMLSALQKLKDKI